MHRDLQALQVHKGSKDLLEQQVLKVLRDRSDRKDLLAKLDRRVPQDHKAPPAPPDQLELPVRRGLKARQVLPDRPVRKVLKVHQVSPGRRDRKARQDQLEPLVALALRGLKEQQGHKGKLAPREQRVLLEAPVQLDRKEQPVRQSPVLATMTSCSLATIPSRSPTITQRLTLGARSIERLGRITLRAPSSNPSTTPTRVLESRRKFAKPMLLMASPSLDK